MSRSGGSIVVDLESSVALAEFTTGTTLRGIAGSAPHQLAYLAEGPASQLVRILAVPAGVGYDVASLEQGSNWKLSTDGTAC